MESSSMPKRQRKYNNIETPEKLHKTNVSICREKQLTANYTSTNINGKQFHPDSASKRSSKTCMKLTNAECTVENF
jgi:hypothetical protein